MQFSLLFGLGLLTGVINTLAGGGSLLTLPALIFLGLPTTVANGTNRLGILAQGLAAIAGFHRFNVLPWRVSLLSAAPAVVGAVLGAYLALDVPDELFKKILAGLMLALLGVIIWDPGRRLRASRKALSKWQKVWFALGFFGVGVFGGFIQAGVGFLVISLMMLAGFDLVATNAIKVLVVFIFTIAALLVFVFNDQVDYVLGVALGLGSAAGGWLGTRIAVTKGHGWIRGFVIITILCFAAKLLFDSFIPAQ
jgi:hypothetical protein